MSAQEWQVVQSVALAALLAWASGVRLYLVVFALGVGARFGYIDLPAGLQVLSHTWVISAAGVMLALEFFADKIPYVDSVWDFLHTFVRIPAGALLAAGATGDEVTAFTVAAGLLGGTITAGTHFTKSATRAAINTSPEPFSNLGASFTEDAMVVGATWLAFAHPVAFLVLLAVFLVVAAWVLHLLWRTLSAAWSRYLRRRQSRYA